MPRRVSLSPFYLIQNRTDISVPVQPNSHAKLCICSRKALHPPTQSFAFAYAKLCICLRKALHLPTQSFAFIWECPHPHVFSTEPIQFVVIKTTWARRIQNNESCVSMDVVHWYTASWHGTCASTLSEQRLNISSNSRWCTLLILLELPVSPLEWLYVIGQPSTLFSSCYLSFACDNSLCIRVLFKPQS